MRMPSVKKNEGRPVERRGELGSDRRDSLSVGVMAVAGIYPVSIERGHEGSRRLVVDTPEADKQRFDSGLFESARQAMHSLEIV